MEKFKNTCQPVIKYLSLTAYTQNPITPSDVLQPARGCQIQPYSEVNLSMVFQQVCARSLCLSNHMYLIVACIIDPASWQGTQALPEGCLVHENRVDLKSIH